MKPLKQLSNKILQVLLNNGFTPEWIQLSKEIRQDTEALKKRLEVTRNKLGDVPLSYEDKEKWENTLHDEMKEVKRINKNIDKYNLIVPLMQKQMLQINLTFLADAALAKPTPINKNSTEKSENQSSLFKHKPDGLLGLLVHIFSK